MVIYSVDAAKKISNKWNIIFDSLGRVKVMFFVCSVIKKVFFNLIDIGWGKHETYAKFLVIRLLLEPTCLRVNLCWKVRLSLAACCKRLGEGPCIFSKKSLGLCRVVQEAGGTLYYGFSEMGLLFEWRGVWRLKVLRQSWELG